MLVQLQSIRRTVEPPQLVSQQAFSSSAAALRGALREDPDIILVGEMRDPETIAAALTLAETGHLVFATLHTPNTIQSIDRIIDVFPPAQQQQVRRQSAVAFDPAPYRRRIGFQHDLGGLRLGIKPAAPIDPISGVSLARSAAKSTFEASSKKVPLPTR